MTPTYITDAGAVGAGAELKLQPRGATPPVEGYITQSQTMNITVWNAVALVTVRITATLLLPDGTISTNNWTMVPTSDRLKNVLVVPLVECFLLSLIAYGTATGSSNRTLISIRLINAQGGGAINTQALVQGYINQAKYLSWPPGSQENSADGAGAIVSVTGTLPAVGVEITEVVPAGVIWQLKSFYFKLATSATAAGRIPHLIIDDGVNVLLDSPTVANQALSTTNGYVTGDNATALTATDNTRWLQLVADLRLMPGYRMRTLTTALQTGDQYTAPQYLVKEWLFN